MGVHTGDSITVAPAQTLTDRELQTLRDWALRILRRVGVACGGANVQFALHPETGRMVVVEMNPRVSRSSALASKATGYPIARVATLLALGYTLDELPNRITGTTVAAFEPSLDYVCVKVPRWAFEKFPHLKPRLTTRMQSVGEAMALGYTFDEALGKALRSTESGRYFLLGSETALRDDALQVAMGKASPHRLFYIAEALRRGWPQGVICQTTGWDHWFVNQISQMVDISVRLSSFSGENVPPSLLSEAKIHGLSDAEMANALQTDESTEAKGRATPSFRGVDTCAGEFEAKTPYFYSAHGVADEGEPLGRNGVLILGSGPNRIGQGLEFDTCCVSAVDGLHDEEIQAILLNCNPETVSTDFDTADRLYFEPITQEDVLAVCHHEKPRGVIVSLGGQTPLNVAKKIQAAGFPILGTSPEGIALAEDRQAFAAVSQKLGIHQPPSLTASTSEEALSCAKELGYPLMLRPSFVLGGAGMAIVWNEEQLRHHLSEALAVSPHQPLLLDRFLEDALEVDLDVLCDGTDVHPCGFLEHIEPAGVHSGDSMQVFPAPSLTASQRKSMLKTAEALVREFQAVGLMNFQFAIWNEEIFLLEANPRASRTIPFLHKATGVPWARIATRLMAGRTLEELQPPLPQGHGRIWVKAPVFPFARFGVDPVLGPEMRSTGEAMGSGPTMGHALVKALRATGFRLAEEGAAFVSIHHLDRKREQGTRVAQHLKKLGLKVFATEGTAEWLSTFGMSPVVLGKLQNEGETAMDALARHDVTLVLNTPHGGRGRADASAIRLAALRRGVPCLTTLAGALAALDGIRALKAGGLDVAPL